jgi:hypothetical protein
VQGRPINIETSTALLAELVMGWKPAPDRFIKSGRSWIPRWRFQPFVSLVDAFELLDRVTHEYTLTSHGRTFTAEVCVDSRLGMASGESKPEVIAIAVARALGIEVEVKG